MINFRFLRIDEVRRLTGLSKATIYRGMDDGSFPVSWQLTGKRVGWKDIEIYEWMNSRKPTQGINRKCEQLLSEVFK